jgi:nucleoside-diphosphate-sugar epimerase
MEKDILLKNKMILVTGGLGFIGTHLINELVKAHSSWQIDVVDNLSNSSFSEARRKFFDRHNIKFFQGSVADFWPPYDKRYDYIYHLASPVGPAGVLRYAGRMGLMILSDAIKMAELALRDNAKLLQISTSEVYGHHAEDEKNGQREDIPKIVPANVTVRLEYGVGKLATEVSLLNFAKHAPLKVNFIRPFNIIGPYQRGEVGFVVPRFVEQALKGEPLTVFGDGSQKRTFTHVKDIVEAMIGVMDSEHNLRIYNVGNPRNLCSVKELAEKIVRLTSSKSRIDYVDPKTIYGPTYEEAWNKVPNIDRIKTEIGWKPRYSLDEILEEYIEFAKGKLDFMNPF